MIHHISAEHLTVDRVREILENNIKIDLSEDAKKRIVRCREYLDNKMETQKEPIYGITTGFGSLCNISIDKDQLSQLQKNLVMSHACGTGERVPAEIVKLMLLLKIQSLSYGNSGVQLETVQRLVDFFNNDVLPVVFQQGSLGASGDLAPLANMCLPLLGLGEVEYKGARRPSDEVLKEFGWKPISLQSKEGLALLNGTQFMSAFGVYSLIKARRLSEWADLIGAMSLDAFDGRINPFIDEVHEIRAHKGQLTTARNFRRLLEGSELIARPKKHVQVPIRSAASRRYTVRRKIRSTMSAACSRPRLTARRTTRRSSPRRTLSFRPVISTDSRSLWRWISWLLLLRSWATSPSVVFTS